MRHNAKAGRLSLVSLVLALVCSPAGAGSFEPLFRDGALAYNKGDYFRAAQLFGEAAWSQPASGTFQNLGLAEWQNGKPGPAILAWERALWIDPFNEASRTNLRFVRKLNQNETPDLAWYEVVSAWLPFNWWAWLAGCSLWLAVAMITLPTILGRPKAAWHQAIAALGLMIFLLTIPAHLGVHTRTRLGFVLQTGAALNLTPTLESQVVARLAAGEPARVQAVRGNYLLIRAGSQGFRGWIEKSQFGLIVP